MNGKEDFRILELNGGQVLGERPYPQHPLRFILPAIEQGYCDAQLDDYGLVQNGRKQYPWHPGVQMQLRARFSHHAEELHGTAGFGFWNAPFGDPTIKWPALPQAVWFFFGSPPNDLPLAMHGQGRGWFASTLDAATWRAKVLVPVAPFVLLANQNGRLRSKIWPWVRERLGISFAPLDVDMTGWHEYRLQWQAAGCSFWVDGRLILQTPHAPRGPLGFVCWLDNQYMIVTNKGRFGWGVLPLPAAQWMEISHLNIS